MSVARVCLDINVFYAALRGRLKRLLPSACSDLVDMALSGQAGETGFQLIVSIPMLEAWANLLQRHFGFSREDAETQAGLLHVAASEGPLQANPSISIGSGFVPFATELETRKAAEQFAVSLKLKPAFNPPPLFDEITDDYHVLLTAMAGRADVLVTTNMRDFRVRKSILFTRDDVLAIPTADHTLVVAKPAFVAHHLRRGLCPSWSYLQDHAGELNLEVDPARIDPALPFGPSLGSSSDD